MARELPDNDFRRVRRCLIEGDYHLPARGIDRAVWDNLANLNDTVLIETIDENVDMVELAHRTGWSWLDIYDRCPKDSPISNQVFAVLECFEGSRFNAFTGWYRTAGIMLRCGLEDVLLGLFFQRREDERRVFDQIVSGDALSPRMGDMLGAIADISQGAAKLSDEARQLYHRELSVYVHRVSHGTIWESTGPIYVPAAFNTWFDQYMRTYYLACELIDAVVPGTSATVVARGLRGTYG
jgi:hypothetical protein